MSDPEERDAFTHLLEYLGKSSKSSYDFELSFPRAMGGLSGLINRAKGSLENKTGEKWDWCPLSQPVPEAKGDHIIVCLTHFWDGDRYPEYDQVLASEKEAFERAFLARLSVLDREAKIDTESDPITIKLTKSLFGAHVTDSSGE
ncbi:uncharacterized protein N7511_008366 [Penicillium nucicola]|uniref:uncharacterized protein n=1 Tax=Penicillium nucicola TaxID=1850975 RepID=UPI002544EA33|nr:uncharacterized protein N7511_008366 [Penicillium nucicola]KAJ5751401.1 hypothetical protein N7511_008366 [Penicillium nucicola]